MEIHLFNQMPQAERQSIQEFCDATGYSPEQMVRAGVRFILDNQDDDDVIQALLSRVAEHRG